MRFREKHEHAASYLTPTTQILQEFALSRVKLLRIGNHSMSWVAAHTIAAARLRIHGSGDEMDRKVTLGLNVLRMVRDVGPDAAENLWHELDIFDQSGCSDDRDRMATFQWRLDQATEGKSLFRTDYCSSTEVNYAAFAQSIVVFAHKFPGAAPDPRDRLARLSVKHTMLEGLLLRSAVRQRRQYSGELPSWMPDWRVRSDRIASLTYTQRLSSLEPPGPSEVVFRRRLTFMAWRPKDDTTTLRDNTLELKVQKLTCLDVFVVGSMPQDGDIVLMALDESAQNLGFRGDEISIAFVLRPLKSPLEGFRLISVSPVLFVERYAELRDAWEMERRASGARASRIWEEISDDSSLEVVESTSVPQLGMPARKVVYYKGPDRSFRLVIV